LYEKKIYKVGIINSRISGFTKSLQERYGVKEMIKKFKFYNTKRYRVATSWLVHGNYTYYHSKKRPYLDIDLFIEDSKGNIVALSRHNINNFEVVEFYPKKTEYYTVKFRFARIDSASKYYKDNLHFGYAISYEDAQDEWLYYNQF
jgi:hypothetical protein